MESLGLGDRFLEVKENYRRVNEILGDIVKVEVLEIDPKTGKISLDRLDKPDAPASASPAPRDKGERHERRERREDNRPGRAGRTPRRRHESGSSN